MFWWKLLLPKNNSGRAGDVNPAALVVRLLTYVKGDQSGDGSTSQSMAYKKVGNIFFYLCVLMFSRNVSHRRSLNAGGVRIASKGTNLVEFSDDRLDIIINNINELHGFACTMRAVRKDLQVPNRVHKSKNGAPVLREI